MRIMARTALLGYCSLPVDRLDNHWERQDADRAGHKLPGRGKGRRGGGVSWHKIPLWFPGLLKPLIGKPTPRYIGPGMVFGMIVHVERGDKEALE